MDIESIKLKFKNFDWRSLKKLTNPNAANDLNHFLEKLPQNTGQTMLAIAAIVWSVAGVVGLYTTVQIQQLTELRAELQEASALKPNVPSITNTNVNAAKLSEFINRMSDTYRGLEIKSSGASVLITAKTTAAFGQFREAVGHIQNGGSGWRVNIQSMCVGRECEKYPLNASLKISKVTVSQAG